MDDQELARRAQAGDPEARVMVFNRTADLVYRIMWRYAAGNRAEAEDLTQKALLQIFEKLGNFDAPFCLEAWTAKLAHNLGVDYVRTQLREKQAMNEYSHMNMDCPHNPEQEIFRQECRELLETALAAEPNSSCQETVRLFYEDGLSLSEIAERQQISVTAATTRLSRFRAKLRKMALKKALS